MPYLKKPEKIKQTSIKREERNEVYTSTRWKKLRLSYLQNHPLCVFRSVEQPKTIRNIQT